MIGIYKNKNISSGAFFSELHKCAGRSMYGIIKIGIDDLVFETSSDLKLVEYSSTNNSIIK